MPLCHAGVLLAENETGYTVELEVLEAQYLEELEHLFDRPE